MNKLLTMPVLTHIILSERIQPQNQNSSMVKRSALVLTSVRALVTGREQKAPLGDWEGFFLLLWKGVIWTCSLCENLLSYMLIICVSFYSIFHVYMYMKRYIYKKHVSCINIVTHKCFRYIFICMHIYRLCIPSIIPSCQ